MSNVKHYGWASNPFLHEHSEGLYVLASDYDALAAERDALRVALVKAAGTLEDASKTFATFGHNMAALAMLLAEKAARAAVNQ